jgi:hypothetical protein
MGKSMVEIKQELKVGDLDKGGVYVGKSATTGKPLYAALADEPEYMTFSEAFAAAEKMKKIPGRENAHVPTQEELDANLYQNRDNGALKGTFNISGSFPAGIYRSSTPLGNKGDSRVQGFVSGLKYGSNRTDRLPVRLVW